MRGRAYGICVIAMCALLVPIASSDGRPASNTLACSDDNSESLFATLVAGCREMLKIQTVVHDGTKRLHELVLSNPDKKPGPADRQAAIMLAGLQKSCIDNASELIALLEKEGSAVAFPEVFRQLREDIECVQRRLEMGEVGTKTQVIQQDVIQTLEEMLRGVGKRRADSE